MLSDSNAIAANNDVSSPPQLRLISSLNLKIDIKVVSLHPAERDIKTTSWLVSEIIYKISSSSGICNSNSHPRHLSSLSRCQKIWIAEQEVKLWMREISELKYHNLQILICLEKLRVETIVRNREIISPAKL